MKKNTLAILLLVIALATTMSLAACGDKGKSGKESGKDGKTITLKVNNFMPEDTPPGQGTSEACKKLEELSGGTIKAEAYYNGTLLAFDDSWQGTAEGAVDIAILGTALIDQNTLLNHIYSNPVAGLNPDQVKTTEMYNKLIDQEPALNAEIEAKNVHWLSLSAMPNSSIHLTKGTLSKPADIKGKKIEGLGAVSSKYWESLGATTVSLDPGDYFTSCNNGVVDGMFTHWACINNFGLNDVLHEHTIFGEYTDEYPSGNGITSGCMGYIMNLDTWKSLSDEQQKWVTEAFRYGASQTAKLDTQSAQDGYNRAKANGDKIVTISGDALKPWIDAMQPVVDEWIAECDKAGVKDDAIKVHDTLLKLVEEYKSK